ncbi:MAG: acyltransferase family protein [Alphaproteobacteria bacterium]|nr:acyltransferase family protein [Alphaproteobacteria bacterium]
MLYRPEINGLRAIAVLAVIFYHAEFEFLERNDWFDAGFIGVDIFFIISGYLITRIILNELSQSGTFNFWHFYERRARRILPMLFVVMLASFPLAWQRLFSIDFIEYSQSIISALFFGSNFFFYFANTEYGATSSLLKPFLHTWSLAVEEQFYIILPLILFLCYKFARHYVLFMLLALSILSLQSAYLVGEFNPSLNFYFTFSRFWELLVGTLIAYHEVKYGNIKHKLLNNLMPLLGLAMIIYAIFGLDYGVTHPNFLTLIPIIGTMLILAFATQHDIVSKALRIKVFAFIGLISYSAYLWHFPIFAFARINAVDFTNHDKLICLAITFALSVLSYFVIEQPFRKNTIISRKTCFLLLGMAFIAISAPNIYAINNNGYPERFAVKATPPAVPAPEIALPKPAPTPLPVPEATPDITPTLELPKAQPEPVVESAPEPPAPAPRPASPTPEPEPEPEPTPPASLPEPQPVTKTVPTTPLTESTSILASLNITDAPFKNLRSTNDARFCYRQTLAFQIKHCRFVSQANNSNSADNPPDNPPVKIVLLGDSQMATISYGLVQYLSQSPINLEVTVIAEGACPFYLGLTLFRARELKCDAEWQANRLKFLQEYQPDILVLHGWYSRYHHARVYNSKEALFEKSPRSYAFLRSENSPKTLKDAFFNGLAATLDIGNDVVMVYDIPTFNFHVVQRIRALTTKYQVDAMSIAQQQEFFRDNWLWADLQIFLTRTKRTVKPFAETDIDKFHQLYPHRLFCDSYLPDKCVAHDLNHTFYSDTAHLSPRGAELVNAIIIDKLDALIEKYAQSKITDKNQDPRQR